MWWGWSVCIQRNSKNEKKLQNVIKKTCAFKSWRKISAKIAAIIEYGY